jgi:hypothetical protein
MVDPEQLARRRVRIRSTRDLAIGGFVEVRDADTDELIDGVLCAVIYLNPTKINEVELTHYMVDRAVGQIITDENGEIVTKKVHVEAPEIDIIAMVKE